MVKLCINGLELKTGCSKREVERLAWFQKGIGRNRVRREGQSYIRRQLKEVPMTVCLHVPRGSRAVAEKKESVPADKPRIDRLCPRRSAPVRDIHFVTQLKRYRNPWSCVYADDRYHTNLIGEVVNVSHWGRSSLLSFHFGGFWRGSGDIEDSMQGLT